jgi:hypothetical protein
MLRIHAETSLYSAQHLCANVSKISMAEKNLAILPHITFHEIVQQFPSFYLTGTLLYLSLQMQQNPVVQILLY